MQVEFKPKEVYSKEVQSARTQRATVKAKLDKGIIDTVTLSDKAPKKRAGDASQVDKVELSTKMSVEDVNRLLQSKVGEKVKSLFEDAGIDPSAVADYRLVARGGGGSHLQRQHGPFRCLAGSTPQNVRERAHRQL